MHFPLTSMHEGTSDYTFSLGNALVLPHLLPIILLLELTFDLLEDFAYRFTAVLDSSR